MNSIQCFRSRIMAALFVCVTLLIACNDQGKPSTPTSPDTASTVTQPEQLPPSGNDTAFLSLLRVFDDPKSDTLLLYFRESARIYMLPRSTKGLSDKQNMIKSVEGKGAPLKIIFDSRDAIIQDIIQPSGREVDSLQQLKKTISKFAPPACSTASVDLNKAKEIFKYCVDQSCPTAAGESPCIPFQYVGDGCYARAHKMRDIVERKYGLCVRKVFSFSKRDNTQTLAVKADKWGGCCVKWWYHVAPVIKVKIGSAEKDYVLDPGMFNEPVPVAQWVDAQKNKTCDLKAGVNKDVVVAGENFWPANDDGTAFDKDPALIVTNQTLIDFKSRKTCP